VNHAKRMAMSDRRSRPVGRWAWCTLLAAALTAGVSSARAAGVFDGAVAAWHFSDPNDSAGKNSALAAHGDVRWRVALTGQQRRASVQRGGDGRVAELRGGCALAGQGADGELNPAGEAMTLCIRLRAPGC